MTPDDLEALRKDATCDESCGPCKTCGEHPLTGECLDMVRECLEKLGVEMSATPAMFYPEAIRSLLFATLRDAGVLPGHPAKYAYRANGDGSFERVELDAALHNGREGDGT